MRSRRLPAVIATLALLAGACSTSNPTGPGSASGSAAAGTGAAGVPGPGAASRAPSAQLAAALLPVTPVLAEGAGTTGVLEPGSPLALDAVGPDGATFHAEFPAGATVLPVTVTMQPLRSIGGLSGAIEAVDFEPSGLQLVKPAVLTIHGPVGDALSARGFGYEVSGEGAVAAPAITASDNGPLRVVVGHFSGYGAAADDPPAWDIQTISATEAADIVALEDFVIANAHRGVRDGTFSDAEGTAIVNTALDAIAAAGKRLGTSVLEQAAKGDVSVAAQTDIAAAIQVILESARADQLLGRPENGGGTAAVAEIVQAYLDAVSAKCTQTHDLSSLTLLLTLARQAQLFGSQTAAAEVASCMAGEVHFTTTLTKWFTDADPNWKYSGTISIDVRAPIDLFNGQPSPDVKYPVASTEVFSDGTCTLTSSIEDGTFTVVKVLLTAAPPPKPTAAASAAPVFHPVSLLRFTDASVVLDVGSLPARFLESGNCGPGDSGYDFTEVLDELFIGAHLPHAAYRFDGGFELPGDGSAVLARKVIDNTTGLHEGGLQGYSAHTVIEIIHTP